MESTSELINRSRPHHLVPACMCATARCVFGQAEQWSVRETYLPQARRLKTAFGHTRREAGTGGWGMVCGALRIGSVFFCAVCVLLWPIFFLIRRERTQRSQIGGNGRGE